MRDSLDLANLILSGRKRPTVDEGRSDKKDGSEEAGTRSKALGEDAKDTREGEDVSLQCRFAPQVGQAPTFFWVRTNKRNHDNVAIQQTPLDINYRLDFKPEQGRYDLLIMNASYDRDNGRFACRVKAAGSGQDLHSQTFLLTVLTPPGKPQISPGPNATATEGKTMELTCSSSGGSPDPEIKWYKDRSDYPLEAAYRAGNSRDSPTTAVLTLTPSRADDGAVYRCVVWNRALPDNARMESSVTLNVNYFPRVKVGPDNPVRVERDGTAVLQCTVDAKPKVNSVRWSRNGRFIATTLTHTISRVTLQDAGKYTCSADNGLGQTGEAEVTLDVLYAPIVTIETGSGAVNHREAEEGESLVIRCNVSANPSPDTIEWLRDGHPEFRQPGKALRINKVTAEHAGPYICRAVNYLNPTTHPQRRLIEKIGNASITLLVRHKPGQAQISPDKPIASEGSGVTLTCSANPPGWPQPQYRWWRDTEGAFSSSSSATVLATGPKYTIPSAHLGSEGRYHCQATNEMGQGKSASVMLEVHQPPRFLGKLQPHLVHRVGDSEFSATCSAQGKPKPSIKWLKDEREITSDPRMLEITTEESELGRNAVYTVKSTLRFVGTDRPHGNQLIPSDRGIYSCVFENEVKRAESSMHLLIEHEPIVLHQYNKVAYDLHETAEVVCRVQAYPRPEFQWSYGTNAAPLLMSSEGHYDINTTAESRDIYASVLKIADIRDSDYGDYYCRVANSLGSIKPAIRLQRKGPPERPLHVNATGVGPNYVTIRWEPGFDGGLQNTKFFVSYKKLPMAVGDDFTAGDCVGQARRLSGEEWQEFECLKNNPCNVSGLEQHQSYIFKVKAFNSKGHSNYSDEAMATTKVDRIPPPQRVTYNPNTNLLFINTPATCLHLVGMVEVGIEMPNGNIQWRHIGEPLRMPIGAASSHKEKLPSLDHVPISVGRSLDDEYMDNSPAQGHALQKTPHVRVKLCLSTDHDHCSGFIMAEVNSSSVMEAGALAMPTLIAIIVSCVVFVLFLGLLFIFCRCKRNQSKKGSGKDYEMETSTVRPSLVTQQPPPPYYPTSGMENKALEHSLDLALDDPAKNAVYASQNGYGYHGNPPPQGPQGHNINGGEWVNMGYMDNSYSNSNNGGSVNSQDSLWQMKMAATANNNANGPNDHHHHLVERTGSYGYDPLTHGGYGAVDDYAPYPHIGTASPTEHEYHGQRNSNNPSRQEYSSDPYAAVHKPKKRMDQHLDSPYHDVSGLPDPYMDAMDCDDSKPQHISLSFDESLESGYSTPNSRNRRVIREIIV
ncbi:cell adhesion molecule Dscam2 [Anabrus simplex]|uniref:cell adhesion molecule Dscam2 n=1 Tax=Anabrus simplex TaxID=316456 RepID=UPI0035A2AE50